jgi:hypothetical protein
VSLTVEAFGNKALFGGISSVCVGCVGKGTGVSGKNTPTVITFVGCPSVLFISPKLSLS